MAGSRKTGPWAEAKRRLEALASQAGGSARKAVLQEGHYLRGKMVEGLRDQAPGGKQLAPLRPTTIAARIMEGFKGTKALIRRGDLRNGITVIDTSSQIFIGVPKTAVSKDGKNLIDIALLHEEGSKTFTIRITPKMRRFLFALFREMNEARDIPLPSNLRQGKKSSGFIVIRIPARPYIRPVFDAEQPGMKARIEGRMAKLLGGILTK